MQARRVDAFAAGQIAGKLFRTLAELAAGTHGIAVSVDYHGGLHEGMNRAVVSIRPRSRIRV